MVMRAGKSTPEIPKDFADESSSFSIFVPGTNLNVDLSQHGNRNEGTPVTLWDKTGGENQVWNFEQV